MANYNWQDSNNGRLNIALSVSPEIKPRQVGMRIRSLATTTIKICGWRQSQVFIFFAFDFFAKVFEAFDAITTLDLFSI